MEGVHALLVDEGRSLVFAEASHMSSRIKRIKISHTSISDNDHFIALYRELFNDQLNWMVYEEEEEEEDQDFNQLPAWSLGIATVVEICLNKLNSLNLWPKC